MSVATFEPPAFKVLPDQIRSKRLLLVAYNFPPVGGAGVQRPAKWAKYLGQAGWDVTVLTTQNPSVPVRDESLLLDLPADVKIVRARTLEPDYRIKRSLIQSSTGRPGWMQRCKKALRGAASRCVKLALQPDPQVLWNFDAVRVGTKILSEQPHDAILVTAPAYSSFYIGATLKRRFGLPLVLDYRDEWDLSGKYLENSQHDWFSRLIQARMQRHLLRRADAVVATTQRSTQALASKLADLQHSIPATCIYNGFDAEDFSTAETALRDVACDAMQPERGKFRLVYIGTLWNLTDIAPLVRAIEHLDQHRPDLASKLELVCVGRKTPEQVAVLNRLQQTSAKLIAIDYCEHSQALQWLRSANSLCLLLSDVPGAERVVPAKLFEYLAVRKDILTIAPAGETSEIVQRFFPEGQFAPGQVHGIAEWLQRRVAHPDSSVHLSVDEVALSEFSRQQQARTLAELLNDLVNTHRS